MPEEPNTTGTGPAAVARRMSWARKLALGALAYVFLLVLASVPVAVALGTDPATARIAMVAVSLGGAATTAAVVTAVQAIREARSGATRPVHVGTPVPEYVTLTRVGGWLVLSLGGIGALNGAWLFTSNALDSETREQLGTWWMVTACLALAIDVAYVAAGVTVVVGLRRTGRVPSVALAACAGLSVLNALLGGLNAAYPWVVYFRRAGVDVVNVATLLIGSVQGGGLGLALAAVCGLAWLQWRRASRGTETAAVNEPSPPPA